MRWLIGLGLLVVIGHSAEVVAVGDRYKDSGKCKPCHNHLVKQWEGSWHAKSHYDNDEYFRKTIDYLARKSRKSLNAIKIECAACHNPRISVTSTNADYEAIAALNLDKDTAATKALGSNTIAEGINCVVCHNIDQIHDELPESKRGIHRVSWMPSGTMSGPYSDAKSPYHKVEPRDFMNSNPNQLCFVCHANDTSEEGNRFINMQSEFINDGKQCVDCHMGPRIEGVAATLRDRNGQQRKRLIREHDFSGAHSERMWQGALKVEVTKKSREIEVVLRNPQPHALPSGFGSREILIEAYYALEGKVIKKETLSLTSRYVTKRDKPTVPHLSKKTIEHNVIPAQGSKIFSLPLVEGADEVSIHISYRLVNDEVREMLELKDPMWSKKMTIEKMHLKL
ncbi:MAG: cytochrome c family protein [Sulfuricurvum sp.]|jgi:nitrate/TMAO reductase-like tetraheme cytochrome c subunit|uniref:multiheme c-type cytochrome n=1 Tax=Sulfuricurvum sp. TaxID=2025608 RepID=UPI0025E8BCFA|nr:multiheme c-type cytochrome [Sulfuricurvum sp.]MCK9373366.1 cytochrome c family protein [Sulfuricurvum sp.]